MELESRPKEPQKGTGMIELVGLKTSFEGVEAVRGIDLSIPEGEVFALLGPNGAGKTTTIRLLVGLLRPDEGSVSLAGFSMKTQAQDAKRELAYIPDRPYIYEKLSGVEYLQFMGSLWGIGPEESKRRGLEVLKRFRMADAVDRLVEGFSHGMKQKLAVAAAFLHRPKVFVIDEPMVGLDPRASKEIKSMFQEVAAEGSTVLLCTHQLEVAESACDRIGIITDGQVTALGTMQELRTEAQDPSSNLEKLFLRLTEETEETPPDLPDES